MLKRLALTPFATVIIWLVLTTAFSMDDDARTLISLIQEPAQNAKVKLIIVGFTLLLILAIVGLFLTFFVQRPVIFALVGGLGIWLCSLVLTGFAASSETIERWEIVYFWISLQLTAGALMLTDTSVQDASKASGA